MLGEPMKRAALFLACYLTVMAGIAGFLVYTHHQEQVYKLETDRAWKGAKLQLMANGVHCDGS